MHVFHTKSQAHKKGNGQSTTDVHRELVKTSDTPNTQAADMSVNLAKLRWDIAEAQEISVSKTLHEQLLQANERLIEAALSAHTIADTAVKKLAELEQSSQLDVLTSTPNRALMRDRLEQAIALAERHKTHIAVLFIDLDHFKQINDTLGHHIGDEVIQLVARRLESVVRDSDTISRHGGDEFLVLLSEVSRTSDATLIARKMLAALSVPYHVDEHVLSLSASVGVSLYPEDGTNALTLINHADAAMYRSKKRGGGCFESHN